MTGHEEEFLVITLKLSVSDSIPFCPILSYPVLSCPVLFRLWFRSRFRVLGIRSCCYSCSVLFCSVLVCCCLGRWVLCELRVGPRGFVPMESDDVRWLEWMEGVLTIKCVWWMGIRVVLRIISLYVFVYVGTVVKPPLDVEVLGLARALLLFLFLSLDIPLSLLLIV